MDTLDVIAEDPSTPLITPTTKPPAEEGEAAISPAEFAMQAITNPAPVTHPESLNPDLDSQEDLERISAEVSCSPHSSSGTPRQSGSAPTGGSEVEAWRFKRDSLTRSSSQGSAEGLRAAGWAAACVASLKSGKAPTPHAARYLRNSLVDKL